MSVRFITLRSCTKYTPLISEVTTVTTMDETKGASEVANDDGPTRLVRVLLPATLVDRLDIAIDEGLGGFVERDQLIREATASYLMELESGGQPKSSAGPRALLPLEDFTLLGRPASPQPLDAGLARVPEQALSGLHNRDYPSLWSVHQLAELCAAQPEGLIRYDHAVKKIVRLGWEMGEQIGDRKSPDGSKLNALFPTNKAKPQSAESAFRDFGLGKISDRGTVVVATGPWFTWRMAQVIVRDNTFYIGVTSAGLELLGALKGLTLNLPHQEELARTFFTYLSRASTPDWRALMEILRLASTKPTRADLIQTFLRAKPHWSPAQASTNVSGYVARCREWGLLQPKLSGGRYGLTELGTTLLDDAVRAVTA